MHWQDDNLDAQYVVEYKVGDGDFVRFSDGAALDPFWDGRRYVLIRGEEIECGQLVRARVWAKKAGGAASEPGMSSFVPAGCVPTSQPTPSPTPQPTTTPAPSARPTDAPSALPSASPSASPSATPVAAPSAAPTQLPTSAPSSVPVPAPSA